MEFKLCKNSAKKPCMEQRPQPNLAHWKRLRPFGTLKKLNMFWSRDRVYMTHRGPKRNDCLSRQYGSLSTSRIHTIPTGAGRITPAAAFLVAVQPPVANFPWTWQSCCLSPVKLQGGYSSTTYFCGLQSSAFLGRWKRWRILLDHREAFHLHYIIIPGPFGKGYCQVVVISISGSLWKGYLHFCLSSGLDYCNSLLTGLHNTALHSLQQAQPAALVFVRKGWFEHIVLIVKPFHQLQQSQLIDCKMVLFTYGTNHGHCDLAGLFNQN